MKRVLPLFGLSTLLMLAACGLNERTFPVEPFAFPAQSTAEQICWVEVAGGAPFRAANVEYVADATYVRGVAIGGADAVDLRFFAAGSSPLADGEGAGCVAPRGGDLDVPLSDVVRLPAGEATPVRAGGPTGGSELAGFATQASFWIGTQVVDDSWIALPGEIRMGPGVLRVRIF